MQDKKLLNEFFMKQRSETRDEDYEDPLSDDLNLSLSRWVAYDALGRMLERYKCYSAPCQIFILIKRHLAKDSTVECAC